MGYENGYGCKDFFIFIKIKVSERSHFQNRLRSRRQDLPAVGHAKLKNRMGKFYCRSLLDGTLSKSFTITASQDLPAVGHAKLK